MLALQEPSPKQRYILTFSIDVAGKSVFLFCCFCDTVVGITVVGCYYGFLVAWLVGVALLLLVFSDTSRLTN